MTMIQRFPAGLLELLAAKTSGWTPGELARDVQPTLDMLQLFGQTDIRHETANNAAAAEGDGVILTVPSTAWWLLYAAGMEYEKTATMTLGVFSIRINPAGSPNWVTVASGPLPHQAFGSTAGDQVNACHFVPPQPWLLAPGTVLTGRVDILGTDLTCDIGLNARVAVLS